MRSIRRHELPQSSPLFQTSALASDALMIAICISKRLAFQTTISHTWLSLTFWLWAWQFLILATLRRRVTAIKADSRCMNLDGLTQARGDSIPGRTCSQDKGYIKEN